MSIAGIALALGLLIYLAYRGISVLVLAPLVAAVAIIFEFGSPILASYTQIFMPAAGQFITLYFPVFLLGAIFGRFMEDRLLGANTPWAVVVASAIRQVRSQILQASLFTDNAGRDDQYSTDSFFNKWVLS